MEIIKKEMQLKEVVTECYDLCDKCGKKIEKESGDDAFKSIFEYKTGSSYIEGEFGELKSLDLCQDCGELAMNLLLANGFKIQTKELDGGW